MKRLFLYISLSQIRYSDLLTQVDNVFHSQRYFWYSDIFFFSYFLVIIAA